MQTRNLPTIDMGYWAAIVAASMCGANAGDLAAGPLGLGHINGLLPMAAIFLAIILAEKALNWTTVAFYWLAIIVLRTMATNLADLGGHDFHLSYPMFFGVLSAFIAFMIWIDKANGTETSGIIDRDGVWRGIPATNWNYWITMLAAGTLGTVLGDWLAEKDNLNFGPYVASLICVPIFLSALFLAYRVGKLSKPWYWLVIIACRTLGTDLGDASVTLLRTLTPTRPMGLWVSTVLTGLLLAAFVYFWKYQTAEELQAAE
jgi:uncharacterized membrane-anchored protein